MQLSVVNESRNLYTEETAGIAKELHHQETVSNFIADESLKGFYSTCFKDYACVNTPCQHPCLMSSSAPSTSTAPPVRNDENIYITEDGKRRRICSFFVPDYSKPKRCIGCNEIKEDWLGTGFLEFEEAREVVRAAKLANQAAWYTWSKHKRPPNIPSRPDKVYAGKGWVGYKDWLGTINLQV